MTWRADLADWLARGPRPHEPPTGSRSVYSWLKDNAERILADSASAPRLNQCTAGSGNRGGRCQESAIHRIRSDRVFPKGVRTTWLARCANHTSSVAETRPL